MELERVFSSPGTLNKYLSGPLGMHLDGFCAWLLKQGFSQHAIRMHLSNVSHLNEHLSRQKTDDGQLLNATDIEEFFVSYPSWCQSHGHLEHHLQRVRHSVSRFVEFLGEQRLFDPLTKIETYQPLLNAYLTWMAHYQNAATGTMGLRAQYLTTFLQWLGPAATPQGMATLSPDGVEAFFLDYARKSGNAARRSMQAAMRTFFRFCLYQGYIHTSLDLAVPTLRIYKLATVPRGMTDSQARQVLQRVNRETLEGLRDYAILQLLFTYGVRGAQVRALRLDQIDWARDQILFEPVKNGKLILLPLTPEVGESLLEYLQNSRPPSPYPQVFLTTRAPYHPLPYSSSLAAIIDRCLRAADIDIPHRGAHTFRHAFATRMLKDGYPLKAVADVLGHRYLGTTFIYTKVDFNSLQQVALDWPEEVN